MSATTTPPNGSRVPGSFSPGSYSNDNALGLRAQLPIAAALVLLLSICAGAAYLGHAGQREAALAAHEDSIDAAANLVRDQLRLGRAGQRTYLATISPDALQAYDTAEASVAAAMKQLDGALSDDAPRAPIAHALREQVAEKLADMRSTLSMAESGQVDAARAQIHSDRSQQLNDAINLSLANLQKSVDAARHAATQRQSRSIRLLIAAIALAAAGAILMAGLAAREIRRQLRLLRKRETQLDRLVASLEARVARRTRSMEEVNQRFQLALDSARMIVFSQDADLTYTWISQAFNNTPPEKIVGVKDEDFLPAGPAAQLTSLKTAVIATGEPTRAEIHIDSSTGSNWYEISLVATRAPDGTVNGLIGGKADISERKHYESHIRTLMREVTHRSKNLLAVVQALMRQTATRARSIEDFSERFSARLDSLAGAYDLLIKDDWRGTTMDQLVRSQLARFAAQEAQVEIAGPEVHVPPDATQNIGMALHELATNAAKYGALSVPAGRVRIHWQIEHDENEEPCCRIFWQESNGPLVVPPHGGGFGQVVIERTVARAVGGRVTLSYHPEGIEWMLVFPLKE
jgi:two-component sensor histidine kinase/CHASE3 domain sensor protein